VSLNHLMWADSRASFHPPMNQRVLLAFSKDKKPPFSQSGQTIPEPDTLQIW
jgi:hypothetical protein